MLMNAVKDRNELVEVELTFELPVYIPNQGFEGNLYFKKTNVAPTETLKVKIPAYATESKEALENYLQNAYEQNGYDMYCPQDANIWVSNGNDKNKGGAFKFECNAGFYN